MNTIRRMILISALLVMLPISAHATGCDDFDACVKAESAAMKECKSRATGRYAKQACDHDVQYHCDKKDPGGCSSASSKSKKDSRS